nr:hypothetical protein [Micromonospora sp. DSM 115978]
MANKSKNADGQIFDGAVTLTFDLSRPRVGRSTRRGSASADVGISTIIETSEAVPVEKPTPWVARSAAAPAPAAPAEPEVQARDVLLPAAEIFRTGPGHGLRATAAVRDLRGFERV